MQCLFACAGGPFLARRFGNEAMPLLLRLLAAGTAHQPHLLSLGTEAVSDAQVGASSLQQAQRNMGAWLHSFILHSLIMQTFILDDSILHYPSTPPILCVLKPAIFAA